MSAERPCFLPEANPLTMLTAEELDEIFDISGSTLFSAEVKRFPRLSEEERNALIASARKGDITARDALVENCLPGTLAMACRIYQEKKPQHTDLMDLVGNAHVKLLERFDKAMESEQPVKYLLSVAAYEMRKQCTYEDPMIQRESHEKLRPDYPTTVSLERKFADGVYSFADLLAGKDLLVDSDEAKDRKHEEQFTFLNDAISELRPVRRHAIIHAYGLQGNTVKTYQELGVLANTKAESACTTVFRGRRDLAQKLSPSLQRKKRIF